MQITIDTAATLSDLDRSILALLMGQPDVRAEGPVQTDLWTQALGSQKVSHLGRQREKYECANKPAEPVLTPEEVQELTTPSPVSLPESGVHFTAHNTVDTSEPETVQAATAEPVTLPARLPDVPTKAVDEDTDVDGVKWDATIHSETRSKTADGRWRKRRTAKNVVVTSTSEAVNVGTVVTGLSSSMSSAPDPAVVVAVSSSVIPPPPATVIPPPPAAAPFVPVTTFRELMEKMTLQMAARKITSKDINEICREHGIESMQDCFVNTALIPSVHTAIEKYAAKAGV